MSQKRKHQRANHDEKEKKQAEKVIRNIAIALLVLGIAYAAYTIYIVG